MTEQTPSSTGHTSTTRRDALGAVGAAGALVLAGCIGGDGDSSGNGGGTETDGGTTDGGNENTVRVGLSVPESGSRSNEGEQMLAGYRLAAQHINEGTGGVTVEPFDDIGGDGGILGRELELVVEDTGSSGSGARKAAETLLDDGVQMFTGGASAGEGVALQEVAADRETVFMGGFLPSAAVSGESCTRLAFNEMYNAKMAADALAPIVGREEGLDSSVTFSQLYPDTDFGNEFFEQVTERFKELGTSWSLGAGVETREGERSYSSSLEEALVRSPDVLFLNYYGLDAATALRDLDEYGLQDLTVVVPIFNRQFARTAGSAIEGVFGTVHWPPQPQTGEGFASGRSQHPFQRTFLDTWAESDAAIDIPSPLSHLAYVQLCQWASAVARAGEFGSASTVNQLEGHTYNYGRGDQTLRQCDHQAVRVVPVVQGLPGSEHEPGSYYKVSDVQASTRIGVSAAYDCNESPAADCSFDA